MMIQSMLDRPFKVSDDLRENRFLILKGYLVTKIRSGSGLRNEGYILKIGFFHRFLIQPANQLKSFEKTKG
jgi:hypothetical protein